MSVFLMILLKMAIAGSLYYLIVEKLLKKVFLKESIWKEKESGWIYFSAYLWSLPIFLKRPLEEKFYMIKDGTYIMSGEVGFSNLGKEYWPVFRWIAFFWVIIMIGKCSLFLLQSHSAKKMFEMIRTEEKDERKYKILERVKEKLNIEKPIVIFIIYGLPSPMIISKRKKADIYLNEKEYSEKELYWILTHECAHDKRNDLKMRNCLYALKTFFWFSPINQWLYDDIYEMGERESDTFVTKDMAKEERYQYARFLLRMESEYQKKFHDQRIGYYAFFQGRGSKYMKQRLESVMLFRKKNKKSKVKQFAAEFLMCAIFGCLVYAVEIVSVQAEDRICQVILRNEKEVETEDENLIEIYDWEPSTYEVTDQMDGIKAKGREAVEYDIDEHTKKQPHGEFIEEIIIKDVPGKQCVPLIRFRNKKEQIIKPSIRPYQKDKEKEFVVYCKRPDGKYYKISPVYGEIDCELKFKEKGIYEFYMKHQEENVDVYCLLSYKKEGIEE